MSRKELEFLLCEMYGSTAKLLVGQGVPKDDINDLMQEIFIDAYNHLEMLRNQEKLQAWLRVIAKNKAHNFLKKKNQQNKRQTFCQDVDVEISKMAEQQIFDSVLQTLVNAENSREILRAVNKLCGRQALIVKLHYGKGYSLKEIADKLELNYNTVKTINIRAIEKLKVIMTDKGWCDNDK